MEKKRLCIFVSFFLILATCLNGCDSKKHSDPLIAGVRDDIMNFGYLNTNTGKYYGLEIDLAYALAEELGYDDVEFVSVTPDNRKDILLNGEVDCLIATYSIVESRQENFDFSAPYYTDYSEIMVEKSTLFYDINDLKGKTIGVLSGTNTGPELAAKLKELGLISGEVISNSDTGTEYDGIYIRKLNQYRDLSEALEVGTVDAVCMDGCIARTYMTDSRIILEDTVSEQHYGVATQKGSTLSKPVAQAIEKMLDDGTIDRLVEKWN